MIRPRCHLFPGVIAGFVPMLIMVSAVCAVVEVRHGGGLSAVPPQMAHHYCGATPQILAPSGVALLVNLTLMETSSTYGMVVTFAAGGACQQSGRYTFDPQAQSIVFDIASASAIGNTTLCSTLPSNVTISRGDVLKPMHNASGQQLMLTGTSSGVSFAMVATGGLSCFDRIVTDVYCGAALGVPATVTVTPNNAFALSIEATVPCAIDGLYVLNTDENDGNVAIVVASSTCTEYLAITNITYNMQPSTPLLTLGGTAYGFPFSASVSPNKCSTGDETH